MEGVAGARKGARKEKTIKRYKKNNKEIKYFSLTKRITDRYRNIKINLCFHSNSQFLEYMPQNVVVNQIRSFSLLSTGCPLYCV